MSNRKIPYVPPELVDYLNEIIPAKNPHHEDTTNYIMWYSGKRSVVEKLAQVVKDQKPRNNFNV